MTNPSLAVIDTLNSLLEAEASSIFHFVGENSPYLRSATAEVRDELESIRQHLDQHQRELAGLIRHLGGEPAHPPKPDPEEQYLDFLSLKFLLPKLVDAKELLIERYERAAGAMDSNPDLLPALQKHLAEMRLDLTALRRIAQQIKAH